MTLTDLSRTPPRPTPSRPCPPRRARRAGRAGAVVPLVLVPEVEPTRPLGALPGVALGLIAGRAGHFPLSLLNDRISEKRSSEPD
jgi:hypothetical protein